jgi:hypothetical protein
MGTRADFYVGRGVDAEWIGSIAWDGYPPGITPLSEEMVRAYRGGPMTHKSIEWPKGAHLFDATTEAEYRERVERFFQYRDDVTRPADGWPWPWEDSRTTDYAYAFDGGKVWASCFGYEWFDPTQPEPELGDEGEKVAVFPQFTKDRMAQPGTHRSGIGVIHL